MKVLTGLITTLVVSLPGLAFAPAADAAPYPHTIKTFCHAKAKKNPINPHVRPAFRFSITTQGNARPNAHVTIKIVRKRDGDVIETTHRFYNRRTETWSFDRLKRGRYTFVFRAQTGPRSVYKNCSTAAGLKVRSR